MLEAIVEIIFGFVWELLFELVVEVLVEFGFHGTAERLSSRAKSRVFVGFAYAFFGTILGAVSVLFFPKIEFANAVIPMFYFIVSPIIAGLSLTTVSYFINKDTRPVRWFELDKFTFGVLFAVAYALARVIFG